MSLDRKARFLKIYANLPLGVRGEIIVVLEEKGPLTWNAVFVEVDVDTPLSSSILEKLEHLGII